MGRRVFLARGRSLLNWWLVALAFVTATFSPHGLAAQRASADEQQALSLATQGLLPLFLKTDWSASSFSADGLFILVVDETRSFILDAKEGRELRSLQLPQGEKVVWSRPVPNTGEAYRWLVSTSGGLLLNVDGRTGQATMLRSIPLSTPGNVYRSEDFGFEFASPTTVLINLNRRSDEPAKGSTRIVESRRLILQSLAPAKTPSSLTVPTALYYANLTSLLSVNAAARHVALASREGTRVVVWRFDESRIGHQNAFRLQCVYDGQEKLRAISPLGSGFIVVNTAGKSFFLDPDQAVASHCTSSRPTDLAQVTCSVGSDIAALAGRSRKPLGLIAVESDFSVFEIELSPPNCAFSKTFIGNVKDAFFAAPIYRPSDLKGTDVLPEWNGFAAAPMGDAVALVAGASLTRLSSKERSPVLVQGLAGRPTGALEVESGPGFILASRSMAPLRAYDVASGRLRTFDYDYRRYFDETFFYNKPYAIASKLGAVVILERDGRLVFREALSSVDTAALPRAQMLAVTAPQALCASETGHRIWVLSGGHLVSLFELDPQGRFLEVSKLNLGDRRDAFKIACSASGDAAVAADSLSDDVFVLEVDQGAVKLNQRLTVPHSSALIARPSLSSDASRLGVGPYLYTRPNAHASFRLHGKVAGAEKLVFDRTGDRLLAIGQNSAILDVSRMADSVRLQLRKGKLGALEDGTFVGGFVVVLRGAEQLEVLEADGQPLGKLVFGDDSQWLFTDGKGRFDTYDVEGRASAYWVMKDDPMRALDPELYMRDYFEPRLLSRLIDCRREALLRVNACAQAFAPIRPVASLNRARPQVEFLGVEPEGGKQDLVTVRMRVTGVSETVRGSTSDAPRDSGAYDLHLRLDGQLANRRPRIATPPSSIMTGSSGWRDASVLLSGSGKVDIQISGVRLPHLAAGGQVTFSAYAFNDDRVKGPTRTLSYTVPSSPSVRRRAFVVAIGAGAYEDKSLDLRYPAADALKLIDTVVPALQGTNRFTEIVPMLLTSTWEGDGSDRRVLKADATKARIRQALEAISGSVRDPSLRQAPATPDDTVIILFSGHGLNQAQEFYLVPYDSGTKASNSTSREIMDVRKLISSAELAHWLRDLIADEIVLVIDACHSSASVEAPDFKPGPMGARGLGQLAYDKGMRVLASTRPNDLAWESEDKGQGLLVYALLEEGLMQRKADRLPSDGTITIGEWLQYGVDRVPKLYGEVSKGPRAAAARLTVFDSGERRSREVSVNGKRVQAISQQPSVFDYRRRQETTLWIARPAR